MCQHSDSDLIAHYDYELPPELIARTPMERRDSSRLLVVDRQSESVAHRRFSDLPSLLRGGDRLVVNDTRVLPARLIGARTATGGKWEGLFLSEAADGAWRLIGQTRGRLLAGETITLHSRTDSGPAGALQIRLEDREPGGGWRARPLSERPTLELLEQFGMMPLPPYLQRESQPEDFERYQTTYAQRPGAVAAPTAGLHFTPEVLADCRNRGIELANVTLHVGMGTFRPVSVERLDDHEMHAEWCELSAETAEAITRTRAAGGRIVSVGTTSVRTLESVARTGSWGAWRGETNLFIRPPFPFQIVDALVTNFHLPRSTLLVLVCTFAGRELMLHAYAEAIRERYRFFSYGDAMLIL